MIPAPKKSQDVKSIKSIVPSTFPLFKMNDSKLANNVQNFFLTGFLNGRKGWIGRKKSLLEVVEILRTVWKLRRSSLGKFEGLNLAKGKSDSQKNLALKMLKSLDAGKVETTQKPKK